MWCVHVCVCMCVCVCVCKSSEIREQFSSYADWVHFITNTNLKDYFTVIFAGHPAFFSQLIPFWGKKTISGILIDKLTLKGYKLLSFLMIKKIPPLLSIVHAENGGVPYPLSN